MPNVDMVDFNRRLRDRVSEPMSRDGRGRPWRPVTRHGTGRRFMPAERKVWTVPVSLISSCLGEHRQDTVRDVDSNDV
jgi:hypothetical protein